MFEPKTYETILDDLIFYIAGDETAVLSDFTIGSTNHVVLRGVAAALAKGYLNLQDAIDASFISQASGDQLDSHTGSFGVNRKQGTLSSGNVIATPRSNSVNPLTVPQGTLRLVSPTGLVFTTTAIATLAGPYTLVPVTATEIGDKYDLAPGTVLTDLSGQLDGNWTFIVGTNGYDAAGKPQGFLRGGSNRESDDQLKQRFIDFINSLSRATYRAVRAAVLSVADVENVVLKEHEPAVGWFTAYIDDGTDAPTEALLAQVRAALDDAKALGIGYEVFAMPKRFVNVTVQVKIDPTFSAAAVQTLVNEQLTALLTAYTFGESLYLSKLMEVCHSVPGVIKATVLQPVSDVLADPEEAIRPNLIAVSVVL